MAWQIFIDGVDVSARIDESSIDLATNSGSGDELSFVIIQKSKDQAVSGKVGAEVLFLRDTETLFSGSILKKTLSRKSAELGQVRFFAVDAMKEAERGEPISEIFREMTVEEIIADIFARYPQFADFSESGVDCDIVVDYAYYGHEKFTDVLRDLAARTGYLYYFDAGKVLHFYAVGAKSAPHTITDTNGSWQKNSLSFEEDGSRIVNWIKVEGDEYTGNQLYTQPDITADGSTEYLLLNKLAELSVMVDGVAQTVGSYGLHDASDYDVLYDYNGQRIIWREDNKPSSGAAIAISGYRKSPIIAQVVDSKSIEKYGILPKPIKNTSIKTIKSAKQYAMAEIARFSKLAYSGRFETFLEGLRAGQEVEVVDTVFGFSKKFIIQGTQTKIVGQKIKTQVKLASSQILTASALLAQLLHEKNKTTSTDKTLNLFRILEEEVAIEELIRANKNTHVFSESIHLLEVSQTRGNVSIGNAVYGDLAHDSDMFGASGVMYAQNGEEMMTQGGVTIEVSVSPVHNGIFGSSVYL